MPPLRGWTTGLPWVYKHIVPTGLDGCWHGAFYKHVVPTGLALAVLFLLWPFAATADDLVATNQTPAFVLDTRLPAGDPGPGTLIVQAESPPFTLDTRLPDGVVPSSGTVVTESGPFTLDTRLPADTTPPASLVVTAESPPFTLDTRLPSDTTPLPNLITQTETPAFTLDTRIPPQDPLYTNLIAMAESGPFTLDTLSGWFNTPAQTLTGGTTGGKARFSPDGLRLAKTDGTRILLWNLHSIRTNFTFTGHAAEVATLDFSPLGDQLLTGSSDGTFRWWDTASRDELGRTNPPGAGTVYAGYASDGARIIAGRGANATLYRVPTLQLLQEFSGSAGSISAVAVCPEGLALAGNSERFALVWNTATGQILCRLTNHTKLITAAAFFPGGTNAFSASLDGTIRIWNTATGTEMLRIPAGAQVGDAALSLDGRVIASCDTANPGTATIWDAQTGSLLRIFTDTGSEASQIKGVALSPDQTALATTHVDGRVRLWDTGLDPRPIYPVTPLGIGTNSPVTLRSHGLYYFEMNADAGRSLVVTLEADPGGGSQLKRSADIPVGISGALSADAEFANLGATQADKNVGAPTSKSLQTPPPGADITAFRMTATKDHLPSVYDYETFAQASVTNLHCEMPMATSTSDKVYVLVFAPYLSAGTIQARIRAEYADFHLSSITPARGGNGGTVTAQFLGTGLTPDTTTRLFNAGGTNVAGQLSLWGDSTKAWFSFDLSGAPAGNYSVEISRAGYVSAILTDAFTIVTGGTPLLQARLSAPAAVRPGRDYSLTLEYANAGDVDIAAPLFIVSTPTEKNWLYPLMPTGPVLSLNPAQKRPQIQTMGPNPIGPVHLLPPGSGNEIPIYFQGDGGVAQMPFTLSMLRVDLTPIDWPALESQLRPPDMAADLWAATWANFKALAGNTWADYARILNIQAYIRANSGQPTTDVAELLASLFSEAVGANYRRTLFATVDASAPAPALPLQFARFTTDALEHRFSLGPLGRGWSHNFEYQITETVVQSDIYSILTLRIPGGQAISFRGGWAFEPGTAQWWFQSDGYAGNVFRYPKDHTYLWLENDGTQWRFDPEGRLTSILDLNSNRVSLTYTGSQLAGIAHSAGPTFDLQYNGHDRLTRLTDHAGQVTDYEYDPAGEHLLRVVSPGAVTNSYTYQPVVGSPSDHALASITFPDGTHQFFSWNSMGRLAEQSRDGGAERLRFTYSSGGVVSVRDDRNAVTTLRLGERGQPLQMTDALGHGVTFNYDANFNLTRLTGPAGDTTEMAYDAQGNASSVINPLAQTVTLGHTALSRLDTLRDARHQLTDFGYDTRGNLTSIAYPDTSAEQFNYDTAGSVNTWQNRRGQTVQFARNAQGQIIRKTYPDGRTIDYAYDNRGQLTNIVNTAGAPTFLSATTSLSYDARGFFTSITYPDGKGFAFEYNAAGRRTRRVGHDGYTLNYGYDAAGRLETLTDGASHELARYAYDSTGRLLQETKGNGTFTTYKYDVAGQLVALTNHASLVTPLSFFNYTYDAKGNRLTMTTAAGVTSYGYDALNQLTGVTYPGGRHVTYAYDAAGNRTVVNDTGVNTAYTANALNQYTQAGATTFGYDADGNLTRRTEATGTTTYDYDTENRLVRVATPTNGVFLYTYDALGNRTAVVHDGVTNRFLHDPVGLVDVAAEYDSSGALVSRYDYAIGLVSRTDGAGNSAFYSFDALGNTRELTGDAGALLNTYDYDAFGGVAKRTCSIQNTYEYSGRWGVSQTAEALVFMRNRFYIPDTGSFTSTDPLYFGGGLNLYRYCRNNPVGYADPLGLGEDTDDWNFNMPRRYYEEYYLSGAFERGLSPKEWYRRTAKYHLQAQNDFLRETGKDLLRSMWEAWGIVNLPRSIGQFIRDLGEDWIVHRILRPKPITYTYPASVLDNAPPNTFPREDIGGASSVVVRPIDPNDKLGPAGIGPNRVVSAQDEMEYLIRFENFASASAPVQELIVVDYLDTGLDWTTVRFKEIAYGDRIVTPPVGSQSFNVRDTPPTNSTAIIGSAVGQMVVDVHGTVNPQTGRMEWRVTALDTNTSLLPMDALSGFLPPENGTGRGQGCVKLGVRPKSNLPIGTAITNIATIVFDGNEPIDTPAVWNIVGDVPSLAVTIAYLPGQIMAGMPFTYTIGLTNTGTNAVTNVVVTNALPSGFSAVSNYVTIGTVTETNGILTWYVGTLTNGADARWFITVLPIGNGTFTNDITFRGGSGLAVFESPSVITVLPPAPTLGVRLVGGQVELFWSTNYGSFHLQKASPLSGSSQWNDLTNTPVIVGQEYRVTDGPPLGKQFYRLAKTSSSSAVQPALGIELIGTQLRLFWPTNATGFHLQSAGSITPADWGDLTNTPATSGGFYRVTLSAPGTSKYFRLVKP